MRGFASVKFTTRWRKEDQIEYLNSCSEVNLHDRAIRDLDLQEVCSSFDLETLSLVNNRLVAIDLEPVRQCVGLRKLFLDGNLIEEIDLEPLGQCTNLRTIGLSGNMLSEVDLNPLLGLQSLEYVYLHDNNLEHVDLFPLHRSYNLRGLHLQNNNLQDINVAPLLLCQNLDSLRLDDNPALSEAIFSKTQGIPSVVMDALIQWARKRGKPPWIHNSVGELVISTKEYGELVQRLGWEPYRENLIDALRLVAEDRWYDAQLEFLSSIGMPELASYDGDIVDILLRIPEKCSYGEGREILYEEIVGLLRTQLESGGSTLLFNVDALSSTKGSVLIPLILERRMEEMDNLNICVSDKELNLEEIWQTYYGAQILRVLGTGPNPNSSRLDEILSTFDRAGFKLSIGSKIEQPSRKPPQRCSLGLLKHVLAREGYVRNLRGRWEHSKKA